MCLQIMEKIALNEPVEMQLETEDGEILDSNANEFLEQLYLKLSEFNHISLKSHLRVTENE